MKNKGFTILELLTVIIILAIIALIATPVIINIIETNKRKAAETSIASIEHAAEVYYYETGGISSTVFKCKDGVCSNGKTNLDIKGVGPDDGQIKIDKEGNITLKFLLINGYFCYKNEENYTCEKSNKTSENTTNGLITLAESKTTMLSNYIIKGNSYQETIVSNNLLKTYGREQGVPSDTRQESVARKYDFNDYIIGMGYNNTYNPSAISNLQITEDTISFNGSGATWGIGFPIEVKPNTTYIASPAYNADDNTYYNQVFYDIDGNYIKYDNKVIFTTPENCAYMVFVIRPRKGSDRVSVQNIQLEKGSVATEYKPYGNSPSAEFPSEIQSVGDLITDENDPNYGKYEIPIKVTGKNLFDGVLVRKALDLNTGQIGSYNSSRVFSENMIYTQGNNKISIRWQNKEGFSNVASIYIFEYDGSEAFIKYKAYSPGSGTCNYTFELDKSTRYIRFQFYRSGNMTVESIFNIQVEAGETATDYESYQGDNYSIYLDQPLRCIGEVCDYIDYHNEILVRNIDKIILTGNENNWTTAEWVGGFGTALSNVLPYNMNKSNGLSSHDYINTSSFKYPGIVLGNNNKNIYWVGVLDVLGKSNITEFKDWLKEQNNNGSPVVIYYPKEKPEPIKFNLPDISINKNISNIYIDTKIKPSEFIVDYYK